MLASQDVAAKCKEVGITAVHIKVSPPSHIFIFIHTI